MTPAPKRRWFRFSLRTLFVVVTVFGVWLGWNLHQVQERNRLMDHIAACGGHCAMGESVAFETTPVPLAWSLLGAEFVGYIELPVGSFSTKDRSHIQPLFPEAQIGRCVAELH